MKPSLIQIEAELKKRLPHPYRWGKKQNDRDDERTNFIYQTFAFEALVETLKERFRDQPDCKEIGNYALNRWYNYWSAVAVERVFCSLPSVVARSNPKDRLVDFTIQGVCFDHKTSVFPKKFGNPLVYARQHEVQLIHWLYQNQSSEQRQHFHNRLFIVLHQTSGEHWQLKAEISWLKEVIEQYMENFELSRLHSFEFAPGRVTLSGLIWAVK